MKKYLLALLLLLSGCNYFDQDRQLLELKVKETTSGEVILSWIPPNEYTDGTPLSMADILRI
jgi:hypothetical protein